MLLKFYGPVICQNRPDVGNIIPINLRPDCFTFCNTCHVISLYWYFKIVNWKCTVSVIIHNNSSLSSGSRYCKPEVISWWKVTITVFYTRFLSQTGQKCAELSAFWQFFYLITSLLKGFFSNVKKKTFFFQKLAGLWLVGEVVNHVGLYGSKVAEGCSAFQRRSCFVLRLIGTCFPNLRKV